MKYIYTIINIIAILLSIISFFQLRNDESLAFIILGLIILPFSVLIDKDRLELEG